MNTCAVFSFLSSFRFQIETKTNSERGIFDKTIEETCMGMCLILPCSKPLASLVQNWICTCYIHIQMHSQMGSKNTRQRSVCHSRLGWEAGIVICCLHSYLHRLIICQVFPKLERYSHLSLNFYASWLILKQKMLSLCEVSYFDTYRS